MCGLRGVGSRGGAGGVTGSVLGSCSAACRLAACMAALRLACESDWIVVRSCAFGSTPFARCRSCIDWSVRAIMACISSCIAAVAGAPVGSAAPRVAPAIPSPNAKPDGCPCRCASARLLIIESTSGGIALASAGKSLPASSPRSKSGSDASVGAVRRGRDPSEHVPVASQVSCAPTVTANSAAAVGTALPEPAERTQRASVLSNSVSLNIFSESTAPRSARCCASSAACR